MDLDARIATCEGCPNFRIENMRVERWCATIDDDPKAGRNCIEGRYARWDARLRSPKIGCGKWWTPGMESVGDDRHIADYHELLGIYNEILRLPGQKLILAGDVIPECPMTLSGFSGRAVMHAGYYQIQWTWLYAEEPMQLTGVENDQIKPYAATVLDAALHVEYCEPGFIHLDRISRSDRVPEKLSWLIQRMGVALPEPVCYGNRAVGTG